MQFLTWPNNVSCSFDIFLTFFILFIISSLSYILFRGFSIFFQSIVNCLSLLINSFIFLLHVSFNDDKIFFISEKLLLLLIYLFCSSLSLLFSSLINRSSLYLFICSFNFEFKSFIFSFFSSNSIDNLSCFSFNVFILIKLRLESLLFIFIFLLRSLFCFINLLFFSIYN